MLHFHLFNKLYINNKNTKYSFYIVDARKISKTKTANSSKKFRQ